MPFSRTVTSSGLTFLTSRRRASRNATSSRTSRTGVWMTTSGVAVCATSEPLARRIAVNLRTFASILTDTAALPLLWVFHPERRLGAKAAVVAIDHLISHHALFPGARAKFRGHGQHEVVIADLNQVIVDRNG